MGNNSIIEVNNIDFCYASDEDENIENILENFSLNITKGSFTAILGHNGSGKSTLAKLFNGLLKPKSGALLVKGISTLSENIDDEILIKQTVGLVFQNPDNQIISTIVEEDIAFGPENLGVPPQEIAVRVHKALKTVDMLEHKDRPPHKLSGGQKQRLAIAGILAMLPECIVLDEPTAMLDPKGRAEVIATITRLNKVHGMTVILITHHMDEVVEADRVVVLKNGKIMMDDTPYNIFKETKTIIELGLEVPQTAQLLEILREDYPQINYAITVEDCVEEIAKLLELK